MCSAPFTFYDRAPPSFVSGRLTDTHTHHCSVLALVPPMQIHLFESTSSKPMLRQMGRHNLSMCMLAMDELGKSYISAIAAHKLFETAVQRVEKKRESEEASAGQRYTSIAEEDTTVDEVQPTTTWDNWPEGYSTSTASDIADVWTPWTSSGAGTQSVVPPFLFSPTCPGTHF